MRRLLLLGCLLLAGGCLERLDRSYPDWSGRPCAPPPGPETTGVALLSEHVPEPELLEDLASGERLLIVVPGVEADDLPRLQRLAGALRAAAGYRRAAVFDWYAEHHGRAVLLPATTQAAAERLVDRCRALRELRPGLRIDVFAHSGGTVVLRKAARELARSASTLRFEHVLFCGTPIGADEELDQLLAHCGLLLNVHSEYDKVNRAFSDEDLGLLPLREDDGPHRNWRFDRTLSGLLVRHDVFLRPSPDLVRHWAGFLRDGTLPLPRSLPAEPTTDLDRVHAGAWWLRAHHDPDPDSTLATIEALLGQPDEVSRGYGVILAAVVADPRPWPAIRELLQDPAASPWLRRQIYRYIVSLEDGELLDLLRWCRKKDPCNLEATRDALRDSKRLGVRPLRLPD